MLHKQQTFLNTYTVVAKKKKTKKSDGTTTFKAILLVCVKQILKNAKHVFRRNAYRTHSKLAKKQSQRMLCTYIVVLSLGTT